MPGRSTKEVWHLWRLRAIMATLEDLSQNKHEIYLTITKGYAPTWETWEGVREFVQNWYDGVLDSYEEVSPPLHGYRRSLKFQEASIKGSKALYYNNYMLLIEMCRPSDGCANFGLINLINKNCMHIAYMCHCNTFIEK